MFVKGTPEFTKTSAADRDSTRKQVMLEPWPEGTYSCTLIFTWSRVIRFGSDEYNVSTEISVQALKSVE